MEYDIDLTDLNGDVNITANTFFSEIANVIAERDELKYQLSIVKAELNAYKRLYDDNK